MYVTECAGVKSFIEKKESKIAELIKAVSWVAIWELDMFSGRRLKI
jgi:hypothetical protein